MGSPPSKRHRTPSAWLLLAVAVVGVAYVGDRWGRTGGWIAAGVLAAALVGMAIGAWLATVEWERLTPAAVPASSPTEVGESLALPSDVEDAESDLPHASLVKANLRGADLSNARLVGVDLSGADLRGANLSGTDLTKAVLRHALIGNDSSEHRDGIQMPRRRRRHWWNR